MQSVFICHFLTFQKTTTYLEVFLPYCQRMYFYKNSNFSFYTKRETLLIQCYLIIFLPTVQSSMTSIFKEIFYYATVPHFAQKANFSLLKIEFSSKKKKKAILFIFESHYSFWLIKNQHKWVGPFLLQTFPSGFPLVCCLLFFFNSHILLPWVTPLCSLVESWMAYIWQTIVSIQ